jgi:hypothetical protein
MKIIQLRRGFRISLSDGEFEALSLLVERGVEARQVQGDEEFLAHESPAARRAFHQRFARPEPLEIDEDRRRPRPPSHR